MCEPLLYPTNFLVENVFIYLFIHEWYYNGCVCTHDYTLGVQRVKDETGDMDWKTLVRSLPRVRALNAACELVILVKFLALIMHNWQNFWGESPDPDRKVSAAIPIPFQLSGALSYFRIQYSYLLRHGLQ